jgi:DegV family protein with EDD domain
VNVVPLSVRFGEESFLDGVELSPGEFLQRLQSIAELPKTSQPAVSAFEAVFRRLVDEGNDVICVTISARLSGTHNAARLAAEAVDPQRIRVVDSGSTAMSQGLVVLETADCAQHGADLDRVRAVAIDTASRSNLLAALETLDYVHKGGRIGKAAHLVGSMLAIKPIVTVRDGEVHPVERTRTWRKALTRVVELTEAFGPLDRLIIGHAGNPSDAAELKNRLGHLVRPDRLLIAEAGPVLITYAGPGAVATGALRTSDRNVRSSTLEASGA